MRKDVKIGVGIGGVLLAVLIVYLLVPKTTDNADQARNGGSSTSVDPATDPGSTGQTDLNSVQGVNTEPGHDSVVRRTEPHTVPTPVEGQGTATADGERDPGSSTPTVDWESILAKGIVPEEAKIGLVAQNPPADDIFADKPGKTGSSEPDWSDTHGGATGQATTPTAPKSTQLTSGANGATVTPGSTGGSRSTVKEHVVQQGENLSMIAAVAYGDAKHYREILKANPNVDERKLRPGTVLKMPDPSTFASAAPKAQQAVARQEASVDSKTQYRVQQGDSLHKIALKLYGKAAQADALYELNKDKIGDDSSRLKLGTVLKLPEPPTATH